MYFRVFIVFLAFVTLSCEDYGALTLKANLSRDLAEISGIAVFKGNPTIYSIADHNNPNSIFGLDSTGVIIQKIHVQNSLNIDWEDLATDGKNTLFIGDFGNNDNDRLDRVIYTVPNISSFKKQTDTAAATKTTFTLVDQKDFPAKLDDRNYDVEAFIYKDSYFYLFTRNRSRENFDGVTKLYKIPAREGNFKAKPISSFALCQDNINCAISSATLSQDGKEILLLTYNAIYRLSDFNKNDFFGGNVDKIDLKHSSQKEAIAFKNDSVVYIADERRAQIGGNIYEFTLD